MSTPLTPTLSREYFRSIIQTSSAGEGDPNIRLLRKIASFFQSIFLQEIINGKSASRVGNATENDGKITEGSGNVFIATGGREKNMAKKRPLLAIQKTCSFPQIPDAWISLSRGRSLNNTSEVFAGEGWGEGNQMNPILLHRARQLRKNQTDTEKYLWYLLKSPHLNNYKFKRQHPISPYIVDFICISKKLIIELDGGQHAEMKAEVYDARRTDFLKMKGYKVLRFWNNDVLQETESVVNTILHELGEM
jgi:very-short-patch-repair endonuclease